MQLRPTLLGLLVLVAGCTGPQDDQTPAPEEECLLGGPVAQPPGNQTAYPLNETHLAQHPALDEVFTSDSGLVSVACGEGLELMAHLSEEGAHVQEGRGTYHHQVYLSHDGTTRRVTLQHTS